MKQILRSRIQGLCPFSPERVRNVVSATGIVLTPWFHLRVRIRVILKPRDHMAVTEHNQVVLVILRSTVLQSTFTNRHRFHVLLQQSTLSPRATPAVHTVSTCYTSSPHCLHVLHQQSTLSPRAAPAVHIVSTCCYIDLCRPIYPGEYSVKINLIPCH